MPRKNKRKKKKNNSIASSLVASMKNGTLGNDDLFANIQKQINVQVTEEEEAREEDKNKEQTAVKVGEIDDNNNNNNNNKLVITSSDDNNDNKKPIIHTPQGKEDHNNNNNNNNNNVIIDGKNAKEVNNNNNNIMSEDFRTYQQQVGLLKIDIDTNHTEMKSSNSYINNKSNYESSIDIDESNIILKNDENKERVKNRIRQKLIQRSKILDRDISFKLQHNIGELLGNYDLISLEVQKHLESENEQSLYAYCNYDMSDEYVRKYTYKQEQIQKQKEDKKKRKKNEDINKKNIQQHHMTDVNYFKNKKNNNNNNNRKKKEEINITNILNKQNKQRLYASRQRLNELELKLEMREAAERQVRKAQLARFLARRTGSKLK